MSYRVFTSTAVCALALSLAAACDKTNSTATTQPGPKGPDVGIVDLDQVATDLGWFREMKTNLEVLEKQFKGDLQARQDQFQGEVQAELKRLGLKEGDKLTPQQDQMLGQMVLVRRQVYGQLQQAANQSYQQYQAEWLKRYREALEPVVKDVGFVQKTKLVLMKSEAVLYSDSTVDLTPAVTAAAREKPPTFSAPPKPQLPPVDLSGAGASATRPAATAPATAPALGGPRK
jgi:Skp family chaperone for outer membrane proteins